jgi:hypothetical protein
MSIEIENIIYDIEDEELDDIEYLEILSLDEIIKDNPSFIALSRNEIYENLNDMFSNNKKAENITQLFYDIIQNNNEKKGSLSDYSNYIFKVDAVREDFSGGTSEKQDDANFFNKLMKLNTIRHDEAKNRYFFSIKYNTESKNIRFKPTSNINTILDNDNKSFPVYYPVFPIDNVNIPIIAAYYKIPTSTINDYIYSKIISHLGNSVNINLVSSENHSNVNELVKNVKPDIKDIIKYLKDCFALDYSYINNIFKRFGYSFDFITESDFEYLCEYMKMITKDEKERQDIKRPFKNKLPDLINKKLTFFDKLESAMKLININDNKTLDILEKLKDYIEKDKLNNIITEELIPIDKMNIYDIIYDIHHDNTDPKEIFDKIRESIKNINNNQVLETIDNILYTHSNSYDIINEKSIMMMRLKYSREHIFDYDNDGKKYIISYREAKEIKEGGDRDNYEGVLDIQNMNDVIDIEDIDNIVNDIDDKIYGNKKTNFNKYLTNINYKDEEGFIESLNIILNIMSGIEKSATLDIDYDLLSSELFKYHRSISTKYNKYKKAFDDSNLDISGLDINILTRFKPSDISDGISLIEGLKQMNMNNMNEDLLNDIKDVILEVNEDWVNTFNEMFVTAVSFWIINIQENILNDTILINENYLNNAFIYKWYAYGSPLYGIDDKKNAKNGVLPYICEIVKDYLKDVNINNIDMKNIVENIISNIENNYKEKLEELLNKHDKQNDKKKVERGVIERDNLKKKLIEKKGNVDKIEIEFINALIYMPGVNYKKIHKYLLGCCLKKIDETFDTDGDLEKAGRKDLIAIKNRFAINKETNKPRKLRYVPYVKSKKSKKSKDTIEIKDYNEEDNISYIKTQHFIYNVRNDENIVTEWLDNMYDKSPLLSNNIIDKIKTNSKSLDGLIKENINIFIKTAKVNNDFHKHFMIGKINYRNILLNICKILQECNVNEDENIEMLTKKSIVDIKYILKEIYKLNKVINDDIIIDIHKIIAYIVSRALCLPFSPDNIENGMLKSIIDIPFGFINSHIKNIHTDVLKGLVTAIFPTMDENVDFINKKREENKQQKLNILNNNENEKNQIIRDLKKAGVKHNLMDDNNQELFNNKGDYYNKENEDLKDEINNDIVVDDEENNAFNDIYPDESIGDKNTEYIISNFDEEDDDDKMDKQEMGFLFD